jgi:hypothetical protein
MTHVAHRFRLLAIVAPVILSCATGRAEILSSNLSGTTSGYAVINNSIPRRAQAFQTTVSNTITGVTVNASMIGLDSILAIYNDDSSKPGSLVYTIASGTNPLVVPTDNNVFSGLDVALMPWAKYWVVLSGSSAYWGYNLPDYPGEGPGYLADNALFSSGSWAPDDNEPYRLEIQAVPEPAGLVLASGPLAFAAWSIARRRFARSH